MSRRVNVGKKGVLLLGIRCIQGHCVQISTRSKSTAYSRNASDEVIGYLRNENRLIVH